MDVRVWTIKKAECQRIYAFTVVLEKNLESSLDCKEIKPVSLKGDQSWILSGRTDDEAETLILWPPDAKSQLIRKAPDAESEGRRRRGHDRGGGGWMASLTRWTWIWASSRSWTGKQARWTGKPGMLQSMGSQTVGHDWRTEQQQQSLLWSSKWHPTPVLFPGKSHVWRRLVGCCPWGRKESDTTKRLLFHFSLSRIGEGSGNPLQCSCLENPRDRGAWWAAVYGVAQSLT